MVPKIPLKGSWINKSRLGDEDGNVQKLKCYLSKTDILEEQG